ARDGGVVGGLRVLQPAERVHTKRREALGGAGAALLSYLVVELRHRVLAQLVPVALDLDEEVVARGADRERHALAAAVDVGLEVELRQLAGVALEGTGELERYRPVERGDAVQRRVQVERERRGLDRVLERRVDDVRGVLGAAAAAAARAAGCYPQ